MLTESEKVAIEPKVRRPEVVSVAIEPEVVTSFVSNQITDYFT